MLLLLLSGYIQFILWIIPKISTFIQWVLTLSKDLCLTIGLTFLIGCVRILRIRFILLGLLCERYASDWRMICTDRFIHEIIYLLCFLCNMMLTSAL